MFTDIISLKNTQHKNKNLSYNASFRAAPMPVKTAKMFNSIMLNPNVKTADIFCHASPDEDTVNAAKVINNYLKKSGIKTSFCVYGPKLKGLFLGHGKFNIKKDQKPSDLTIILDFISESKISKSFVNIYNESKNIIGFDHHQKTHDKLKGLFYNDDSAYSCCGIIYRFFESLGEKLSKSDLKSLYCGVLSDYQKSKLITFDNFKLVKLPALNTDKNSKEVLEKIESQLSEKQRNKIYTHLDVLSKLTPEEKSFKENLYSKVKVTPNAKLAYVIIDPDDKEWISLGMKNTKTSPILRNLRLKLLNGVQNDNIFTPEQKEQFKNLKGAIVFYRAGNVYQMSLHTKNQYATDLIEYIKKNLNPDLVAGGHPDRAGGRIFSLDKNEINTFINNFLIAAEKLG